MSHKRTTFKNMTADERNRFCGGRAAHNARRKVAAEQRRMRVAKLLLAADITQRGWQSAIARELDCHRGTVCRDIAALAAIAKNQKLKRIDQELQEAADIVGRLERSTEPNADVNTIPRQFGRAS